ncbi:hypothetical protein [Baekduia sp. Peel2402]|uniref:hypothetical protein n=1 Tax=Baekduia sp. Peel2402 TaxID=3458296 RepID=UPI00403E9625
MDVVFLKPVEGRRYRSRLRRADGRVVELEGGSWNRIGGVERELPHDLAHLVVESGLAFGMGLWGVIAAGGLFGEVRVVEGRRPPHGEARGRAITEGAGETLRQAEILVRAVCDAAVSGEALTVARVGERWWDDALASPRLDATIVALRDAARAWARTPGGGELRWPASL